MQHETKTLQTRAHPGQTALEAATLARSGIVRPPTLIRAILILLLPAFLLLAIACGRETGFPRESEWVDHGIVLDTGWPKGRAWDSLIEGFYPCNVIERNGTLYLYYGGSDQYIARRGNIGPAHRSIGVATSQDGLRWEKFPGNPVLQFGATGNPEEGIPSAGFHLQDDGEVIAFYAAGDSGNLSSTDVHFDIRLAASKDGLTFTDLGEIMRYDDPAVYQSGDELFPVAVVRNETAWNLYYHGGGNHNDLSIATGPTLDSITATGPVRQPDGSEFQVWGSLSVVPLDNQTFAIFSRSKETPHKTEIRTAGFNDPVRVSFPVETYDFDKNPVFFLDKRRKTWFMYYNDWRAIFLKTAPFGKTDTTPPSPPGDLVAAAKGPGKVRLAWSGSADADTGILEYRIYRNGEPVGKTRDRNYEDTGRRERTSYDYGVSAVNLHGTEGPVSFSAATTLPDTTPPGIVEVRSGGNPSRVMLVFNEMVDEFSATSPATYKISDNVSVIAAEIQEDKRSILLTTSPHEVDRQYTIQASGISDRAGSPNTGNDTASYTCASAPGLAGYWRFDEGEGRIARDSSGRGSHAELQGNVSWEEGVANTGIRLGGEPGYVQVVDDPGLTDIFQGSVTMSAWVKLLGVPPNTDFSDRNYSIFRGPNLELWYRHDRRFVVQAQTDHENAEFETETAFEPGRWLHLAVVRDNEPGQVSLYVNGTMAPGFPAELSGRPLDILSAWGKAYEGSTYARHHNRFSIGVSDQGLSIANWFAHAEVDEVRLYDRALGAGEIELLAVAAKPSSPE